MRPREEELIDPEIAEELDAIDATLAGDPVAPRFAELAELALLLAAGRPEGPRPEFAHELDRRVQARFPRVARGGGSESAGPRAGAARTRRWHLTPALGAAGTALAAVVVGVAVAVGGGGSGGGSGSPGGAGHGDLGALRAGAKSTATVAAPATVRAVAHKPVVTNAPTVNHAAVGATAVKGVATTGSAPPVAPVAPSAIGSTRVPSGVAAPGASDQAVTSPPPTPVPNGRKITQSSTLQLGAPASRIDAVAQEVFDVVGAVQGIVDSSSVASTGGPGANAQFQLRIPSSSLPQALSELSRLRYANVVARTDNTQDINSSFVSADREIADARSAITKLRVKLAAAIDETEIAALRAQIANENATITQAQASLRSLGRRVDYSRVDVSIQANTAGGSSSGGGFGLHQAGHDALRVLEVSAGVALIALAVMVPIGLLAALGWWLGLAVQRRRRERALDTA